MSTLNIHWKDWCWSSNTLATWCKELTYLKRPWCWERLKAGGEGDDRGWDGWMASLSQWTWVWARSRSWWWIGRPGVLQSMGVQRVGYDWVIELNRTLSQFSNELPASRKICIFLDFKPYNKFRNWVKFLKYKAQKKSVDIPVRPTAYF